MTTNKELLALQWQCYKSDDKSTHYKIRSVLGHFQKAVVDSEPTIGKNLESMEYLYLWYPDATTGYT